MSNSDIKFRKAGSFSLPGAVGFQVQAGGTPPAINPGEPVAKALGQQYASPLATNKPVVGTDFLAGISVNASSESLTVDGNVDVIPLASGIRYEIAAKVPATFGIGATPVQATYNALVGKRVLLDLTAGAYTILAVDGATNGCVIEDNNVNTNPGVVVFSLRAALAYNA